jgi:spermidine/putrescine-binding protein
MMKRTFSSNISIRVFSLHLGIFAFTFLLSISLNAQIAPEYEVATWHGFKPAAVSYTFDDNTSKQLPVAIPLFNQYNFKATFLR